MPEVRSSDKAPVKEFLQNLTDQILTAIDEVEISHPQWRVHEVDVTVRGCLRPLKERNQTVIYLDIDEPGKMPISELPLRFRRDFVSSVPLIMPE